MHPLNHTNHLTKKQISMSHRNVKKVRPYTFVIEWVPHIRLHYHFNCLFPFIKKYVSENSKITLKYP